MGLYKDLDVAFSDSVKANYHRIVNFAFDSEVVKSSVVVKSYVSKADADAGKDHVGVRSFTLSTVNPLELIAEADVGTPVMLKVQALLEAAIIAEVPEFAGAVIG